MKKVRSVKAWALKCFFDSGCYGAFFSKNKKDMDKGEPLIQVEIRPTQKPRRVKNK